MNTRPLERKPAPRWRRRKDTRPAEILAAALEIFGERGYDATRLEDVGRRAGCTKGTVFLYYESKSELFKAAVRTEFQGRAINMVPILDGERAYVGVNGMGQRVNPRLL